MPNYFPDALESLALPEVDLVVACFLIYNRDTRTAIQTFVERWPIPVLLVNENLTEFQRLLADISGRWEDLFFQDSARGILIPGR